MECRSCEAHLADAKELFFFVKSPKEVSLVVKPEFRAILEVRAFVRVQETKKKVRIKCKSCFENVGTGIPFGPNGIEFIAFGPEKIIFCGNKFSAKRKWSELLTSFQLIDRRNMENFFGETIIDHDVEVSNDGNEIDREIGPQRFASKLNDFEWFSLTPRKKARQYQIEAYIEALQQDLVVIIDTGLGKTLIATMVIARMKQLNPDRMAVMLVDRIPLVFQQGQSIMVDTDLKVCRLCSENRTKRRVKQLHDGTYDVLVITAGSFLEMLNRKQLKVSEFCVIVFDECHHATGEHVYTKVIKKIRSCLPKYRPRVLGLTASPFNVENLVKGRNQLVKFRSNFLDAAFFYPNIDRRKNEAIQVTIERSWKQNQFISEAMAIIQKIVGGVNSVVKGYCNTNAIKFSRLFQLKGNIKALIGEYPDIKRLQVIATDALFLIDVIEVCDLLGIRHAVSLLKNNDDLPCEVQNLLRKYAKVDDSTAPRLARLENLLAQCSNDTRAIVFVRTQLTARRIFDYLATKFPTLNPRMVLGHGGYYGMNWEDEQKPVLADFRDGKTNLLVATSVLEEGLDVAECDLVIRYSGPNTMINFIQSRGRARKPGSKFYVFIDEDQRKSTCDFENQESVLQHLINVEGSRDCLPSPKSRRILEHLQRDVPSEMIDQANKNVAEKVDNSKVVIVEFYVRVTEDELNLQDALVNEIEQYDIFSVHRLHTVEKSAEVASGAAGIFSNTDKAFLLSLKSEIDDTEQAYECLCKQWDFKLSTLGMAQDPPYAWCTHDVRNVDPNEAVSAWQPICVEFGKFTSKQKFESSVVFCQESNDVLNIIQENQIQNNEYIVRKLDICMGAQIELTLESRPLPVSYSIKIPLTDVNNFALISADTRKLCLYIPYKSSPVVNLAGFRICGEHLLARFAADNSVIAISFEPSLFHRLRRTLSLPDILSVPIFSTRVQHEYSFDLEHTLQTSMSHLESDSRAENCIWIIKALSSRKDVCIPNKVMLFLCQTFQRILEEGAKQLIEFEIALNEVFSSIDSYWTDLKDCFERHFENLKKLPPSSIKLAKTAIPPNHVMVKRIVVTPTRIVCLPATPVASNRLLRRYGNQFEFIIVAFREEQLQKLQEISTLKRVRSFIENGITIIKHYWFFCASASQLRDHKAYFVAAESFVEVQELRSKIVKNKNSFTSAAKYMSRVGLFCTADKQTVLLPETRTLKRPDIKAINGELVTDGCGKISKRLMEEIRESLAIENEPSAYQVRFRGVKGVLVAAEEEDEEMQNADIVFRDSMDKFENDDEHLCVVGAAKYIKLYLNREVITLLTSINQLPAGNTDSHWLIEHAITEMHEKAICDAAMVFEDAAMANLALMEYLPKSLLKQVVDGGFDLLTEQFWFSLLQHVYRLSVIYLRNKTRIPVDEGCLIMGAADPKGLLRDNEIFLKIKEDDEKPSRVITGDVLIYRNPCLHPGDLRWVTAVNHSALHQWENVVLLPSYNIKTSLAAECSGGDLDGDQFAVIWDPRFIPPDRKKQPPLDYSELAKGAPKDYQPDKEASLFADLFVKIMANDTLGRVANTHLALCDILPEGACDPLAMELAKSQSQAVDFPKTGIVPMVPKNALEMLKAKGYPDFMEKGESSYISEKLLGALYRRCRSLMFDFEILTDKRRGYQANMDNELIVDGHEDYLDDALDKFDFYRKSFREIMVHFSLRREAEVVLGRPLHWDPLLKADKGSVSNAIARSYDALVQKYREVFFRDVISQQEIQKKASAWYRVSYDKRLSKVGPTRIYSFAWVVHDILCKIKHEKKSTEIERPNKVPAQIGASIYEELRNAELRMESIISSKENVLRCVKAEIDRFAGKGAFTVEAYGSVSMYLCEEESDLDVCLTALDKAWLKWPSGAVELIRQADAITQAKHFLEMTISHAVDGIANEKIHKVNAKVPLITINVGDTGSETKVDISFNKVGLLKTNFMHELYNSNHNIFPLFWILVQWARSVGLVKSGAEEHDVTTDEKPRDGTGTEGLIASAEFYVLVINLLDFGTEKQEENEKRKEMKKVKRRTRKQKTVCSLPKIFENAKKASLKDKIQVAEMLVKFFRRGSTLDSDIELEWAHEEIPNVLLTEQIVKLIAIHCMNALHCILATRSIVTMLSSIRDTSKQEISYSKKLPNTLINAFGKAQSFHSARLESVTGARVKIEDERILIATGTRSAIMKLKQELHSLSVTNRALMLGRLPKQSSRYFMEGATVIIVKQNPSSDAMVVLEESKGPWNMLHLVAERHHPKLRSETVEDWYDNALDKISGRLMQQMYKMPLKNDAVLDSLNISIIFGCFYTIEKSKSIPVSEPNISIGDLEMRIEKGRRNRKQWQRGDFVEPPEKPRKDFVGKKVKLRPAVGQGEESNRKPEKKKEKKKSSVAASFCAGVLAKNSKDRHVIDSCVNEYEAALKECGFREGKNGYIRDKLGWKVHCWPSTSYEATLRLNNQLKVDLVEERALKWICVNILDGDKQQNAKDLLVNHDFRVNIVTKDAVKKTTELYKKLVPNVDRPILELKQGKPIVSADYPASSKSYIATIHHVHTCLEYCKENFDAIITKGTEYSGKDFNVTRVFCDLTLRYNPHRFKEFLKAGISSQSCREMADELCRAGVQLSHALKERIQQL